MTRSSALAYLMPQKFSAMHWYIPESSKVRLENFNSPFPYYKNIQVNCILTTILKIKSWFFFKMEKYKVTFFFFTIYPSLYQRIKGNGFPDATQRIVCSEPMSTWVLLIVSAHSGAAKNEYKHYQMYIQEDIFICTPLTLLTLNVEPGLVPVLSFSVDGFAIVSTDIFILNIVQMKHSTRFADFMICWKVSGVHFPPYNVWDGTEYTQW